MFPLRIPFRIRWFSFVRPGISGRDEYISKHNSVHVKKEFQNLEEKVIMETLSGKENLKEKLIKNALVMEEEKKNKMMKNSVGVDALERFSTFSVAGSGNTDTRKDRAYHVFCVLATSIVAYFIFDDLYQNKDKEREKNSDLSDLVYISTSLLGIYYRCLLVNLAKH